MDLKVKLSLVDTSDSPFMGIGLVWLLQGIERLNSIRKAAEEMDLSYVKALAMINRLEEGLGKKVVNRERGGKSGGGTTLTSFGAKFVRLYNRFQLSVKRRTGEKFRRFQEQLARLELEKS